MNIHRAIMIAEMEDTMRLRLNVHAPIQELGTTWKEYQCTEEGAHRDFLYEKLEMLLPHVGQSIKVTTPEGDSVPLVCGPAPQGDSYEMREQQCSNVLVRYLIENHSDAYAQLMERMYTRDLVKGA